MEHNNENNEFHFFSQLAFESLEDFTDEDQNHIFKFWKNKKVYSIFKDVFSMKDLNDFFINKTNLYMLFYMDNETVLGIFSQNRIVQEDRLFIDENCYIFFHHLDDSEYSCSENVTVNFEMMDEPVNWRCTFFDQNIDIKFMMDETISLYNGVGCEGPLPLNLKKKEKLIVKAFKIFQVEFE